MSNNQTKTKTYVRVQYISQINAFHRFTECCYLPPGAQLLWFKLIDLCNTCAWQEWVQADTKRLMHWIDANDARAAYRARDALVRAGLLEYERGHKGCPNRYRILFFPDEFNTENGTVSCTQSCTQNGTENGTQNVPDAAHINRQDIEKDQTRSAYLLSASADAQPRPGCAYEQIVQSFNRICTALPQVQTLNERRKQAIRTANRAVETFGGWDKLFTTVQQSDFLTGRSGAWNGCGFDWIIKPANLVKILEGNYTDTPKQKETRYADSRINTGRHI